MKEKSRDRRKNSSYPEIRVKRVWVNEFQLYFISVLIIDIAKFALLWKVMQGSLQLLNQWIFALYTEV